MQHGGEGRSGRGRGVKLIARSSCKPNLTGAVRIKQPHCVRLKDFSPYSTSSSSSFYPPSLTKLGAASHFVGRAPLHVEALPALFSRHFTRPTCTLTFISAPAFSLWRGGRDTRDAAGSSRQLAALLVRPSLPAANYVSLKPHTRAHNTRPRTCVYTCAERRFHLHTCRLAKSKRVQAKRLR